MGGFLFVGDGTLDVKKINVYRHFFAAYRRFI